MASTTTTSSTTKMTKGTQRLIAKADIKHHLFPMSLFLTREEFMNLVRYGAKNAWVHVIEQADGSLLFRVQCDGTGNASRERLLAPAESNGGGTSRYAAGLPVARLKRGDMDSFWSVAWKTENSDRVNYMSNDHEVTRYPLNEPDYHPWTTREQHGFVHTTTILPAKLEGVTLDQVAPILREILCASMNPETLENLHIELRVTNKEGATVAALDSKSPTDRWMTLEEAVLVHPNTRVWAEETIEHEHVVITAKYVEVSKAALKGKNAFIPNFPHYGTASSPHALLSMEGFVVADPRIHEAMCAKPHPSSQNRKYLFVKFALKPDDTDVDHLPTPASTKTSFLNDCPIYKACMEQVRAKQPAGWLSWKKAPAAGAADTSSDSDTSAAGGPADAAPAAGGDAPAKKPRKSRKRAAPEAEMVPEPPADAVDLPAAPAPVEDEDLRWIAENRERLLKPNVIAELRRLLGLGVFMTEDGEVV